MSSPVERWECPNCATPLNIAALGIYAKVACPACGHIDHVHTMLANFRIEGVLGLGGMSVVLRARDLVLERPLAIKLLNEFYRDQPERIERFEQECELMAKVRHENVVSLYSAGRVKGQFYIAMELVNGRNLEDLVREEGPMDPVRALDILSQVVQGLAAAYKAGLLHRDMKPANILVCEDGQAKVLDFGLSQGRRDADTEEIIWATPYYVPPETLLREAEDVRTDMYALGMTLRHLLTGQGSFSPVPEGIEEILACKQTLPAMAEVLPDLPEGYSELIDHMTAYRPEERPESYASLLEEIAEVRAAFVEQQRGVPLRERLRRLSLVLGGAVLTLALGAGAATLVSHLATPEPELLYTTPAPVLAWYERDSLAFAMELLQKGDTHAAANLYEELAGSAGEPTACAWAALHAAALSILHGEEEADIQYMLSRYEDNMALEPASAGRSMFAEMKKLTQAEASPNERILQAFQHLNHLTQAVRTCRVQEEKQHLRAAHAALRGAGEPYASMVRLVSPLEKRLETNLPERAAACYREAVSCLDVPEATRVLAVVESAFAASGRRQQLAVEREALALLADAVEMMKRHSLLPAKGTPLPPGGLAALLEPLGNPQLVAELTTLHLVAMGDFEDAARRNPYAQSPQSAEPFAVIMRDWLSRVSR